MLRKRKREEESEDFKIPKDVIKNLTNCWRKDSTPHNSHYDTLHLTGKKTYDQENVNYLTQFIKQNPLIRRLELIRIKLADGIDLIPLLSLGSLHSLTLTNMDVPENTFQNCRIPEINITFSNIYPQWITHLNENNLNKLTLRGYSSAKIRITDNHFEKILSFKALKILVLENIIISDKLINLLKNSKLTELHINKGCEIELLDDKITPTKLLTDFVSLKILKHFTLSNMGLLVHVSLTIFTISKNPSIESMCFYGNTYRNYFLDCLRIESLTKLTLINCSLRDLHIVNITAPITSLRIEEFHWLDGLRYEAFISHLPLLKELSFENTYLGCHTVYSETLLDKIASKKLERLSFNFSNSLPIELIKALAKLSPWYLRCGVEANHYKAMDSILAHLKNHPTLEVLCFTKNKTSLSDKHFDQSYKIVKNNTYEEKLKLVAEFLPTVLTHIVGQYCDAPRYRFFKHGSAKEEPSFKDKKPRITDPK